MTTRLRRLGVCAAAVGVLAAVVPATASATPVITMSGSTSVAPLATLLAKAVPEEAPRQGEVQARPGRLGRRRRRRGRRPRDDRQLLARPEAQRSGRPRLQQDRPDAICLVTNPANPLPTSPRSTSRRSSPARSATGARCRARRSTGTIDLVGRTAASGTQDAFQKIFMGSKTVISAIARRRPPTASSSRRSRPTRTRSATSRSTSPTGVSTRRATRRRLQPAQRQVRPVPRRAQLLDGHPRARRPGVVQKFITWVQNSPKAAGDRRQALGPADSDARTRLRQPWSDRRAELMLGALACAVLLIDRADGRLRRSRRRGRRSQHNGLRWFGPGGNVDVAARRRCSTRRRTRRPPTTPARLAADLRARS